MLNKPVTVGIATSLCLQHALWMSEWPRSFVRYVTSPKKQSSIEVITQRTAGVLFVLPAKFEQTVLHRAYNKVGTTRWQHSVRWNWHLVFSKNINWWKKPRESAWMFLFNRYWCVIIDPNVSYRLYLTSCAWPESDPWANFCVLYSTSVHYTEYFGTCHLTGTWLEFSNCVSGWLLLW